MTTNYETERKIKRKAFLKKEVGIKSKFMLQNFTADSIQCN